MRDINEILRRLERAHLEHYQLCVKTGEEKSNEYLNQITARGFEIALLEWVLGGAGEIGAAPYFER